MYWGTKIEKKVKPLFAPLLEFLFFNITKHQGGSSAERLCRLGEKFLRKNLFFNLKSWKKSFKNKVSAFITIATGKR